MELSILFVWKIFFKLNYKKIFLTKKNLLKQFYNNSNSNSKLLIFTECFFYKIKVTGSSSGNYICICPQFYSGTNCQTCKKKSNFLKFISIFKKLLKLLDSNACSNSPCLNGATCQVSNNGASYTCTCPPAYSGTNCQICKNISFFAKKRLLFGNFLKLIS